MSLKINHFTKEGFQIDAHSMAPSANQISSLRAPANHSVTGKDQFGILFKLAQDSQAVHQFATST